MKPTFLLLCLATACDSSRPDPYPYCKGTYTPLEPDEVTPFGYSAQDLVDLHGLAFTGSLTWELVVDPGYTLPLPPDSAVDVALAVGEIRWGTYVTDTGGLAIAVDCPTEGLEIDVEGAASLPGLDLDVPVEGRLLAATWDDDTPAADELSWHVKHLLDDAEVEPFVPMFDAYAEAEGIDYERLEATLALGMSATVETASVGVTWFTENSVVDAGTPWRAVLDLDREAE